jgi:hypothetical protein
MVARRLPAAGSALLMAGGKSIGPRAGSLTEQMRKLAASEPPPRQDQPSHRARLLSMCGLTKEKFITIAELQRDGRRIVVGTELTTGGSGRDLLPTTNVALDNTDNLECPFCSAWGGEICECPHGNNILICLGRDRGASYCPCGLWGRHESVTVGQVSVRGQKAPAQAAISGPKQLALPRWKS